MSDTVVLALAQVDLIVGDVAGNAAKILEYAVRAREELRADLVVFPELSVCGYPPEDLLFHSGLRRDVEAAIERIRSSVSDIAVLIGFPEYADGVIYNACAVYRDGRRLARLPQATAAELRRVRRKALFCGRPGPRCVQAERYPLRTHHL